MHIPNSPHPPSSLPSSPSPTSTMPTHPSRKSSVPHIITLAFQRQVYSLPSKRGASLIRGIGSRSPPPGGSPSPTAAGAQSPPESRAREGRSTQPFKGFDFHEFMDQEALLNAHPQSPASTDQANGNASLRTQRVSASAPNTFTRPLGPTDPQSILESIRKSNQAKHVDTVERSRRRSSFFQNPLTAVIPADGGLATIKSQESFLFRTASSATMAHTIRQSSSLTRTTHAVKTHFVRAFLLAEAFEDAETANQFTLFVYKENLNYVKTMLKFVTIMNVIKLYFNKEDLLKVVYGVLGEVLPLGVATFLLSARGGRVYIAPTTASEVNRIDRWMYVVFLANIVLPIYDIGVGDNTKVQLIYIALTAYCTTVGVLDKRKRLNAIFSTGGATLVAIFAGYQMCGLTDVRDLVEANLAAVDAAESGTAVDAAESGTAVDAAESGAAASLFTESDIAFGDSMVMGYCPEHCEWCSTGAGASLASFTLIWFILVLTAYTFQTSNSLRTKFLTLWRENRRNFEILQRMHLAEEMDEAMKKKIASVMADLQNGKYLTEDSKDKLLDKANKDRLSTQEFKNPNPDDNEDKGHHSLHEHVDGISAHVNSDLIRVAETDDIDLFEVIGQGAQGVVYRGMFKDMEVAVKQLLPKHFDDNNIMRFHNEIKLMSTIRHPNVIRMVGCSFDPCRLCMLLEFASQGSLGSLLRGTMGLNEWMGRKIVFTRGIANGMSYLHNMSPLIVHRDLKLENILVMDDFSVKISDLGEATRLKDERSNFDMLTTVGTPWYVAPENFRGDYYDEKTDVYSFAITLIAIHMDGDISKFFFGDKPRSGLVAATKIAKEWRPKMGYNIPVVIAQLAQKCWTPDPHQRPSFSEIASILDHIGSEDLAQVIRRHKLGGEKVETGRMFKMHKKEFSRKSMTPSFVMHVQPTHKGNVHGLQSAPSGGLENENKNWESRDSFKDREMARNAEDAAQGSTSVVENDIPTGLCLSLVQEEAPEYKLEAAFDGSGDDDDDDDDEDMSNFESLDNIRSDIKSPDWEFVERQRDFEIFSNPNVVQPVMQTRSKTHMRGFKARAIFDFIINVVLAKTDDKIPQLRWVKKSKTEGIVYTVRNMAFPLTARDMLVKYSFANFGENEFIIFGHSINDSREAPENSKRVRMQIHLQYYHIVASSHNNEHCSVNIGSIVDFNGKIPKIFRDKLKTDMNKRDEVYLKEFELKQRTSMNRINKTLSSERSKPRFSEQGTLERERENEFSVSGPTRTNGIHASMKLMHPIAMPSTSQSELGGGKIAGGKDPAKLGIDRGQKRDALNKTNSVKNSGDILKARFAEAQPKEVDKEELKSGIDELRGKGGGGDGSQMDSYRNADFTARGNLLEKLTMINNEEGGWDSDDEGEAE